MTWEYGIATADDDPAIRRLLHETPMRGAVSVGFEREPDYFFGANVAGGADQIIVARNASQLLCVGRCTRRSCWVNGRETPTGYLAELRLAESVRGRFRILRDGYRFFDTLRCKQPGEIYFTSIASDNERARRVLERGLIGMPRYEFVGELETLLIAVPRRSRPLKLRIKPASAEDLPEMVRILNEHGRRHHFAAVWTLENLTSLTEKGLPTSRFLLAYEGNEIVACGALWDQRAFRQTVIHSYSPGLSFARPFLNAVSALFGTPRLPRRGSLLAQAFLSPLGFANGHEALLPDFAEGFFPSARQDGVEFLTLALPAMDSRLHALRRRFSTRTYHSRLYRVDWPGEPRLAVEMNDVEFLPDVALL